MVLDQHHKLLLVGSEAFYVLPGTRGSSSSEPTYHPAPPPPHTRTLQGPVKAFWELWPHLTLAM